MKFGDIVTWDDPKYSDGRYMVIGASTIRHADDISVICLRPPRYSEWNTGEEANVTVKDMVLTQ